MRWDERANELLLTLAEQGLSVPELSGRLTALYGEAVTEAAIYKQLERLGYSLRERRRRRRPSRRRLPGPVVAVVRPRASREEKVAAVRAARARMEAQAAAEESEDEPDEYERELEGAVIVEMWRPGDPEPEEDAVIIEYEPPRSRNR